jgi:hypothetical protein
LRYDLGRTGSSRVRERLRYQSAYGLPQPAPEWKMLDLYLDRRLEMETVSISKLIILLVMSAWALIMVQKEENEREK